MPLLLLLEHLRDDDILRDEGVAAHPPREHEAVHNQLELLGRPLHAVVVDRRQRGELESPSALLVEKRQVLFVWTPSFL